MFFTLGMVSMKSIDTKQADSEKIQRSRDRKRRKYYKLGITYQFQILHPHTLIDSKFWRNDALQIGFKFCTPHLYVDVWCG